MALPAKHLDTSDAQEWVSVEMASKLTGLSVRHWRRRAAQLSGQGQAYKAPPPDGGTPVWFVHRSTDARLARCPDRGTRDAAAVPLLAKYPQHLVERGLRRNHWLQKWRRACESRRPDGATDRDLAARIVAEAKQAEQDLRISVRSLYLWWKRYKRLGNDGQVVGVEGLVDRYSSADDGESPTRSPEARELFFELYHTTNRLKIQTCHEAVCREAKKRSNWTWPKTAASTAAWLRQYDDIQLTCLMRWGVDVWARRYLPHLKQDYSKVEVGAMSVGDHTQLDLFCLYKGEQIRPWLTAFQDLRSRCIVGWHIGPTPHQDAILYALRMAFRDWAIPRVMRIDNGKDFTAKPITGYTKRKRDRLSRAFGPKWRAIVKRGEHLIDCTDPRWLGITGELDVELIYATPYAAWSKGTLERFFGTAHDQHDRLYPTYCGNAPQNKPECLEDIRRGYTKEQERGCRKRYGDGWKQALLKLVDQSGVPTIAEVRQRFAGYRDTYHRTEHRGLDGWTPLAVWKSATRLRRAVGDELAFLMDVRGLYKVTANGVSLKVGVGILHYGAKSQALKRWVGRKVLVALDPDDVSHAWAYTPDREKRQLIGRLDSNESIAPYTTADDARESIAEVMRERSVMHKARRAQARRTLRMAERMQEHSQAKRAELLATGTDAVDVQPTIVPVRTGFEGVSKPARSTFEATSCRPLDAGDVSDLFDDTASGPVDVNDGAGMEDLFAADDPDEDSDGLDGLL